MNDDIEFIRVHLQKPVVLIGMMGTGKSRLGRLLASQLGLEFHDSDFLVEQRAGCRIHEVFERFGEEKFRQSEMNVILNVLEGNPCVLSTGGGAVVQPRTLEAIKAHSISVWLDSSIDVILKRVEGGPARPLLQASDDPAGTLRDLMAQRRDLYAQADLSIDASGENARETVRNLIKELSALLNAAKFP